LSLTFNLLLWWYFLETETRAVAWEKATQFLTAYLIEKSLSIDNMFAFLMIFQYLKIPIGYQRRVLTLGVFGAIFMRLGFILLGIEIIGLFHWILYLFGFFLFITGVRMFFVSQKRDLGKSSLLVQMKKHLRITHELHYQKFFIRKGKLLYVTPLFLALVLIETSDLIFALDSIPAVFAITNDPFIVFTSNIFAILGLRSLYFLLANMARKFYWLRYGLALILCLVGAKMLLSYWFEIHAFIMLAVVIPILGFCLLARKPKN